MKCQKVKEKLYLYVSSDLSSATAGRIKKHLEICPDCRKEAEEIREVLENLKLAHVRDSKRLPDWSEERWARLMYRLSDSSPERKFSQVTDFFSWKVPAFRLAIISGVIFAVIAGFFFLKIEKNRKDISIPVQVGRVHSAADEKLTAEKNPAITTAPRLPELNLKTVTPENPARNQPLSSAPRRMTSEVGKKAEHLENSTATNSFFTPGPGAAPRLSIEAEAENRPDRIEMAFTLPESGVQLVWILDRNFHIEGGKK